MNKSYLAGLTKSDWLCLSFLDGIGPARLSRLYTYLNQLQLNPSDDESDALDLFEINKFEESEGVGYGLSYELLRTLKWPEITARQAMDYLSNGTLTEEQKIKRDNTLVWLDEDHHHLVLQEEEDYPDDLKEISVAPAFLYLEGSRDALMLPKIGIVGARKCTRYGRDATFQFAKKLSDRGVCVVSGGAMGIDTAAHQGALESQITPTLVIMGTGLLHRYPTHNTALFEQVLEQGGALISEYPLTISPKPHLFPPRNRIISGLSMGILVSEASIKSGSLISASYAVQQNREVFTLPGRLSDPQSEGCHELLRQGATLVRHVDDILAECVSLSHSHIAKLPKHSLADKKRVDKKSVGKREKYKKPVTNQIEITSVSSLSSLNEIPSSLSAEARVIAKLLEKESYAMDFDSLIRHTKMNAGIMMQVLMELELSGCVENREGLYNRC
ncbi:DNA processing protein DprA [Marinomonas ushuaiensis DSM 15871]|uniref:DNA processing protein DprA n=1 Tax=Marinomonas ushuaiensis DSM 15871 TaxID=1122207 RepID=X7EAN6_9GAMM|nr:DNA-processing protein DprA [Marinomonas ushuaiensis]ETX12193.1 DNA processing protein DprA [Marinomonas ushuaiensis DSM 15871]